MREVIKQKDCVGRKLAKLVVVFICMLASLLGIGLFSNNNAYADDSISLSISTGNIALNLFAYDTTGTFAESPAATITASTTNSAGYTLSIASSTGSTDLTNTTDNTSKITSISSNLTTADFSNAANTQHNNKWGYKPSQWVTVDGDTYTTTTNTGNNAAFRPLPGAGGEILAITDSANATGASDTYSLSIGARINTNTPLGSYDSDAFIVTAVANPNVLRCDNTKLCVEYDGNGLEFDGELLNRVNYDSIPPARGYSRASYNEDGTYNGYTTPAGNDVVTIAGASSLHIEVTYGVPQNNGGPPSDLYIWAGNYPSYTNSNNSTSLMSCGSVNATDGAFKSNGNPGSQVTMECDIEGDSVTFYDYSQYGVSTGYYAVVTSVESTLNRTVSSGEYAVPTGTNVVFNGWSTTATTPGEGLASQVEYADEIDVMDNMPGENGDKEVLYAVWQQTRQVTFIIDGNVSNIDIVDSDGVVIGTITASGQSLALAQGSTYTIRPTYATGFFTDAVTKTSGVGTLTNKVHFSYFTIGNGVATINITSKPISPMQNYDCSSLPNVGDTDIVYDTRDNSPYMIGRLADNECWMLDNLALDLLDDNVLNSLSVSNTDIDTTNDSDALAALKGISVRDASTDPDGKYATAKVAHLPLDTSYSYSDPFVDLDNKDVVPTDEMSTEGGYRVGGYYNFCAVSAGSYCYGDGGTTAGTPPQRISTSSICPKGWQMPTRRYYGSGYDTLANAIYGSFEDTTDPIAYANYRAALRLPLSGGFGIWGVRGQGESGSFWSSSLYAGEYMYVLDITTVRIDPFYNRLNARWGGLSLRCIVES